MESETIKIFVLRVLVQQMFLKGESFSLFTKRRGVICGVTSPITLFPEDHLYVNLYTGEVVLVKRAGRMIWEWGIGNMEDDRSQPERG